MQCPCGSGRKLPECCGLYHSGIAQAPTAEKLMRSRYSAYALHEIDYIVSTQHPSGREELELEDITEWSNGVRWLGLEIVRVEQGEDTATVEFKAAYEEDGKRQEHHERSSFVREGGVWYYLDGESV